MGSSTGTDIWACRQLTANDTDEIAALYRDLVGEAPIDVSQLNAILGHPGTTMWGAERDGRVASMLTLHLLPNVTVNGRPYGLIENVVTLQAAQGLGAGRAVMEAAIDHAWAANAYKIMLLTMQDGGARGFYEKFGFRADQKFGMQLRRAPPRQVRD